MQIQNFVFGSIAAALMLLPGVSSAQSYEYPFQNPSLPEEERLDNAVSLMTLDEKISTIVGQGVPRLGIANPGSTEAIHGIVRGGSNQLPNMGFAGQFQQAGQNKRRTPPPPKMVNSTAFPQAYGVGETWDREMAHIVGDVMSYEARYYSKNSESNCLILWAPNADLARDPRWGRTEESFGEDPYLVGEMVAAEVKGIQGDDPVYWRGAALMKHFLANSNEDNRYSTDSRFDESLFRDYYSYGFWKGAKAGAKSLMTAYNRYNGVPCIDNPFITDILNKEWGMDGTIVDDAGALLFSVSAHKYAKDINEAVKLALEAGLTRFIDSNFQQVKDAYDAGLLSDELIDERTKSNLRTMLRLGLMDASCPYDKIEFGDKAPWETDEFKEKARLVAQKSVVLLKNDGDLLPLDKKKVKKIAVFGNRAEQVLKDWYGALPAYSVSPLDGIKNAVKGEDVEVRFQRWDSDGSAQEVAKWADVCIVCVGNHPATSPDWGQMSIQAPWGYGTVAGDGREALDRRSLQLETEDLIKVVWQANHNTVVALISSFPYAINWTAENVPAIVHITQCGQELGNAIADVIFGDYNPAGRTTQTWVSDILDLPNLLDYDIRHGRTYMYFKGKPIFPFGFGLSYTKFKYSKAKVRREGDKCIVSFNLQNIGQRDGEEVVQLYAKFPGDDASKRLRGFERIALAKGEKKRVEIVVPEDDLKLWDAESHGFVLRKGKTKILVGASSDDIRLKKNIRF